jgi:hypothetical protein
VDDYLAAIARMNAAKKERDSLSWRKAAAILLLIALPLGILLYLLATALGLLVLL